MNVPLANDKLLTRISAQYDNRDGYYENQTPGADDLSDADSLDLRAQFLYAATDSFDALLILNYGSNEGAGSGVKGLGDYPLPPPIFVNSKLLTATPNPTDPWEIRTNGIAERDNSRGGATLTMNWDLGVVAVKSITAGQDNEVDTFVDLDFSDADILNENRYQDSTRYSQELQFTSTDAGEWEWLAGLYWLSEETDAEYWLNDNGEGLSTFSFFPTIDVGLDDPTYFGNSSTTQADSFGAFGQASYTISDSWKIGSKNRFFNNQYQANISAYYYEYTDMQLRTIRDLSSVVTNAGESEIKGVEVELVGRPTQALELSAAFAFTNAEFTDYFDDDPQDGMDELLDLSGNTLPRSPDATVNLAAAYNWDFESGSLRAASATTGQTRCISAPITAKTVTTRTAITEPTPALSSTVPASAGMSLRR